MSVGEAVDEASTDADAERETVGTAAESVKHTLRWSRVLVYGVLPGAALVLGLTAGYLRWQVSSAEVSAVAAEQSVQAAEDATIALLSYRPDSVKRDLTAAQDRTTGAFRASYTDLTNNVVIPGAIEQQISTVVTIPAAASVSADANHAVALLFVNQTTSVGADAPNQSVSSIRVTLEKITGRWLVSGFDPV